MGMRIRMVLGCLAACGAAVIMTGLAAQAAPLAVTHGHPAPAISSGGSGNSGWNGGSGGSGSSGWGQSPSSPCTSTPSQTPPAPQTATPIPTTVATTSAPPSGAPQTGGGGSISGGDGPMAAGGVATALVGGIIGLFAFRRWRRTRLPAA